MIFDIVVLAVIGILTIIGFWKGTVRQLFGLLGVVSGYVLALRYYQLCSKFLTHFHPGIAKAISFIAICLVCIIVAHLIAWAVERFINISKLGFFNRVGGGVLGFLKGCIVITAVVMIFTTFLPAYSRLYKKSHTIKYISFVTAVLKKVTREDIKAKYNEMIGKEKPPLPTRK
jgi:membrane protein required for colicin V production